MSRHSKWSKVKQFKGAIDAKRSASFTKMAREITVAAREKGADPNMNARLRAAIGKARDVSMPRENIERAVARGAGTGEDGQQIESLTYEAYASGGTALIIECLTDNRNRTANDIRHVVTAAGGSLANTGSVAYLFDRLGVVRLREKLPADRHDEIELQLIDVGVIDLIEDDVTEIRTKLQDLNAVAQVATKLGLTFESADFEWVPKTLIETDEATGIKVADLIEELEGHDDVSRVYSNLA